MASTAPAKSQPLHNFSLPHLIWKNHRSGRNKLAGDTSSSSPPHRSPATPLHQSPPPISHINNIPHHPLRQTSPPYVPRRPSPLHKQSPMRDFESESEPSYAMPIENPSRSVITPENPAKSTDTTKRKRSNKISIRFRKNDDVKHDGAAVTAVTDENSIPSSAAEEEEQSSPKTWNLRPRRPPMKHKHLTGGLPKIGSSPLPDNRNSHGSNNSNRESSKVRINDHVNPITTTTKKQKFSISLSRNEIEEDIFSLTGLKPSRRPKKRPRSVQRQLDAVFPGLWLGTITADSYKVAEPVLKG